MHKVIDIIHEIYKTVNTIQDHFTIVWDFILVNTFIAYLKDPKVEDPTKSCPDSRHTGTEIINMCYFKWLSLW